MNFLEIKDFFFKKKLLFSVIGVLLLVGMVAVWLILRAKPAKIIEEKIKKEIPKEFERKSEKLEEIESAIERTKKELETLSTLSPEEKMERERKRTVLSAQKVTDDVSIEGVEVTVLGTKKMLLNQKEGYRIEMPANLVIARSITSDWIELHDKNVMCQDPSCDPVMRIRVQTSNRDELPIEEWFIKEEKKAGTLIYSPRERFAIGQESVYRVLEEIPARFEGYYYYWGRGKKIYDIRISVFDDEIYRYNINTFSFLPAP